MAPLATHNGGILNFSMTGTADRWEASFLGVEAERYRESARSLIVPARRLVMCAQLASYGRAVDASG
jgi:hypothetical protein